MSFDWSRSVTDGQSLEIKKSVNSKIDRNGPSQDEINHDEDAIYLLLSPTVNLGVTSSSAAWLLANVQSPIQYVYVGWLNGHIPMPGGVATVLASAGITSAEYPAILARDPLASGANLLDLARFSPIGTTFPYEPPLTATDPVPTITTNITDSSTETVGSATEDTYKVAMSMSGDANYLDFAKSTLKDTLSWQWTDKSSASRTTGNTQSASLTIGGPSFGYSGPTVIEVFEDSIYHTFAFMIVPIPTVEVSVQGRVASSTGEPIGSTEVTLEAGGVSDAHSQM